MVLGYFVPIIVIMDNKEVSKILTEIGTLLELKGENPFKSRAYYNGAQTLERIEEDVKELVEKGVLSSIKGMGKALTGKITELVETGRLGYYEDLKKQVPSGLLEMLSISGLGPSKIKAIYQKLGITTIGELEYACMENRLSGLPGFGVKTQESILKGVLQLRSYEGRFLYSKAADEAGLLLEELKKCTDVTRIELSGELRRRLETVKGVEILVGSSKPPNVIDYAASLSQIEKIGQRDDSSISFTLPSGIDCSIRVTDDGHYPYVLQSYTGNGEHNRLLREKASKVGFSLTEQGLFKGEESVSCQDEESIFKAIGLDYIPPELREGADEILHAEKGNLPRLITDEDIEGVIHVHTNASDGSNSLEEMAQAALEAGYSYLGIADHSRSSVYASGLSIERLKEQGLKIDELNGKGGWASDGGIRLLKGSEVDILPDGNLDYPDEVLAELDFVIVSVHSRFNMGITEMTGRIIKAMQNPHVNVLGHLTGRLLLSREGYPVNVAEIIEAAHENNVVIETNANPRRLDLDWRHLRRVKEAGVKVAINPDAHRVEGFSDMAYGIGIARKGWLEAGDVINTMSADELLYLFK